MRSLPRYQERLTVSGLLATFTTGWKSWFQDVCDALGGWNSAITGSATLEFGNIPMASELSLTTAIDGAAVGDFVIVRPGVNTVGLLFTADVTAAGFVTVHAKNFSTDFIDPPSIDFKFIILQN